MKAVRNQDPPTPYIRFALSRAECVSVMGQSLQKSIVRFGRIAQISVIETLNIFMKPGLF